MHSSTKRGLLTRTKQRMHYLLLLLLLLLALLLLVLLLLLAILLLELMIKDAGGEYSNYML